MAGSSDIDSLALGSFKLQLEEVDRGRVVSLLGPLRIALRELANVKEVIERDSLLSLEELEEVDNAGG